MLVYLSLYITINYGDRHVLHGVWYYFLGGNLCCPQCGSNLGRSSGLNPKAVHPNTAVCQKKLHSLPPAHPTSAMQKSMWSPPERHRRPLRLPPGHLAPPTVVCISGHHLSPATKAISLLVVIHAKGQQRGCGIVGVMLTCVYTLFFHSILLTFYLLHDTACRFVFMIWRTLHVASKQF